MITKRDMAIVTDNNIGIFRSISMLPNKTIKKERLYKIPLDSNITIAELYDKAIENEVYNIWVAPYTKIMELFTVENVTKINDIYLTKGINNTKEGLITFVRLYKIGHKDVTFTIPENNYLWKLNEYEDIAPSDLLIMLVALKENLPVHIANSPTSIGINILEYSTPNDKAHWLRSCDFELGTIPLATNLVWKTLLPISPKKYFHTYDRRGSFLSSYGSTLLGSGNCKHVNRIDFDNQTIGVYRVELIPNSSTLYTGDILPIPYNIHATDNWLWTPEIKISQILGYNVTVHEAYIWEEGHYIFREWARILFDSRLRLEEKYKENNIFGYQLAIDTIKKIYTETGGRLANRESKYERKDVYKRYDWWSMIVSDNRLKVLWNVNKLVKLGYYPILIDTDEIGLLSNEINPLKAFPTLTTEQGVGSFKPRYSFEWSLINEQFFKLSTPKFKELLKELKKQGKALS